MESLESTALVPHLTHSTQWRSRMIALNAGLASPKHPSEMITLVTQLRSTLIYSTVSGLQLQRGQESE